MSQGIASGLLTLTLPATQVKRQIKDNVRILRPIFNNSSSSPFPKALSGNLSPGNNSRSLTLQNPLKAGVSQRDILGRRSTFLRSQEEGAGGSYKQVESEAAKYVVDSYVRDDMTVGIGASGPAARAAVHYICRKLGEGRLQNVKVVAMSNTAASEAAFAGLSITPFTPQTKVDFAFDYVDLVDDVDPQLPVIKGCKAELVQPNIEQEREIINAAELFIGFADSEKVVPALQGSLPVMIDGDYWEDIAEELDDIFIGDATIWRRPETGNAPPNGGDNPFITATGRNILDIIFEERLPSNYASVAAEIEEVPGVIAHGLYLQKAHAVVVLEEDEYRTLAPFLNVALDDLLKQDE